MPVNLLPPDPQNILAVPGVALGCATAGIRKGRRNDLMLMSLAPGSRVAGVFTQNSFAAAPVQICRRHLGASHEIRALIVNAGNANCGNGAQGLADALHTCHLVAQQLNCAPEQVLPFSTGVILQPLPVKRIADALPGCVAGLCESHWLDAAAAIMTTDTVAKAVSRQVLIDGVLISVTAIAKGVGMIQPNMATMLAYIATDAAVAPEVLRTLVKQVADVSFNRVTIDGDTSTNDSLVLIATGQSALPEITQQQKTQYLELRAAIVAVAQQLAQAIARDGEGATKLMTIQVGGAADEAEAVRVAKSIAHSPLVKTAFFASDPNLGRLIMAIGNAGVANIDVSRIEVAIGDVQVISHGQRCPAYREEDGQRVMQEKEIVIDVDLKRGSAQTVVWTCDFSYDYVKINAEYRT